MKNISLILLGIIILLASPCFSLNAAKIYQNLDQIKDQDELMQKVKEAQSLPGCNFMEGITEQKINSFMGAFPSPQKMIEAGRLILEKGNEEKSKNKFSSALDYYLMNIRLASDLARHKSLLSLKTSMTIENMTLKSIFDFKKDRKTPKSIKRKMLKALAESNSKRIPLIDFIKEEHRQNAAIVKLCLTSEKQINTIYFKRTRDNYHKYGKEIYKQAAPLLDYYYNKIEDAVKRNSEEKINEYGAEIAAKVSPITASGRSPWDPIYITNEKLRRFIPHYLANVEKESIPKIAVWQVGPRLIDVKAIKALLEEYIEIFRENQELITKP